jgi:valyl-tRNA synthetase
MSDELPTSEELSTRHDPASVEPRWIDAWERAGVGRADPASEAAQAGRTFMIAIPPPNVTGVLHMGHALNNTLQDVVIRMRRMQGF